MAIFLTLVCLSLVCTVVTAVLLGSLLDDDAGRLPERVLEAYRAADRPGFFEPAATRPAAAPPPAAVEELLRRIEQHVRLERAAAESFHWCPTPELLHTQTGSPLMH